MGMLRAVRALWHEKRRDMCDTSTHMLEGGWQSLNRWQQQRSLVRSHGYLAWCEIRMFAMVNNNRIRYGNRV
jgi:hypothetical protein